MAYPILVQKASTCFDKSSIICRFHHQNHITSNSIVKQQKVFFVISESRWCLSMGTTDSLEQLWLGYDSLLHKWKHTQASSTPSRVGHVSAEAWINFSVSRLNFSVENTFRIKTKKEKKKSQPVFAHWLGKLRMLIRGLACCELLASVVLVH